MTVSTVTASVNGQTYTLTYNSTSLKWEATITAPTQTSGSNNNGDGPGVGAAASGKGYYPISVTATDNASNETTVDDQTAGDLGAACRLKVLEKVLPTCSVTYPSDGATITTATPEITVTCADAGSGINSASGDITIDGSDTHVISLTQVGSTTSFEGSYTPTTPLADGVHSLTFRVSDFDGNQATSATVVFTVDTLAPSLSVSEPVEGLATNQQNINVVGVTTDVTSSPVTVTITVNGTDQGAVTLDASGNFTKEITLTLGANVIVVKATDTAGKFTEVTRNVTYSTTAPEITNITVTPNPVDAGQTYIITVTVTDS